jgi:hypothetical protein
MIVGALMALRLMALAADIRAMPSSAAGVGIGGDATRFHQIANGIGTPYRDFTVEIPPVALWAIDALDGSTSRNLAVRLGITMLLCDLAIAFILFRGWGTKVALSYLILGTPLATFLYLRLDLLSVFFAVTAIFLAEKHRPVSAGISLTLGMYTKVWPLALLPAFAFRRHLRALQVAVVGSVVGASIWMVWAGISGPLQVLTFRHASGWEETSEVGLFLSRWTSLRFRFEAGAWRVGTVAPTVRITLFALTAAAFVFIWKNAAGRSPAIVTGFAPAASIAALLVFSPILSSQYVAWLVPWVAIGREPRQERWMLVVALGASVLSIPVHIPDGIQLVANLVRNLALVGLLVDGLWPLHPRVAAQETVA